MAKIPSQRQSPRPLTRDWLDHMKVMVADTQKRVESSSAPDTDKHDFRMLTKQLTDMLQAARDLPENRFPPITEETIERLKATLATKQQQVDASAASDNDKATARRLTEELTDMLNAAVQDPIPVWVGWIQSHKRKFGELAILHEIINSEPKGACNYAGGCIQTTKPVCDDLGGAFSAGAAC
jgi:hypothetical protein